MSKTINTKIYTIISEILKISPKLLEKHVKKSKVVNNWDSLNHIKIILKTENVFKIKFTQKEIETSIDDKNILIKYINNKIKKKFFMKKLNCLFLRNITLEPIEEMLVSNAKKYDMNIKTIFSDYDNILQSSLDLDFLKNKKIDVINVFLWLPNFSDTLSNRITSSSQKKINNEINRLNDFIQIVSKNLSRLEIPVIWTSMNLSYESTYGLFDYKFENSHENILGKINTSLKKIISVYKNFYYYDLTKSERSIGSKFLFDQRFWYTAKSPFSHDGFNQISKDLSEMLFSIFNKRSKCLVLDCDNVLWGGIVGENGVNGIKISNNGDSEFTDFQKEVINLQKSGIILAICSKNNIQDVFEVFEKRKDMILKKMILL